jgi:hypothetical protein
MQPTKIENVQNLDRAYHFCTCCGRKLKGKVAMLEFSTKHCQYFDAGVVAENDSQGFFPFGMSCARKVLKDGAFTFTQILDAMLTEGYQ